LKTAVFAAVLIACGCGPTRASSTSATRASTSKPAATRPAQPPAETAPLTVGGDVSAPIPILKKDAVITKDMKCRGLVLLGTIVDANGLPTHIRDLSPSPDAFTHAHAVALESWRFRPAMRRGKPVPVRFNVTIQSRCR